MPFPRQTSCTYNVHTIYPSISTSQPSPPFPIRLIRCVPSVRTILKSNPREYPKNVLADILSTYIRQYVRVYVHARILCTFFGKCNYDPFLFLFKYEYVHTYVPYVFRQKMRRSTFEKYFCKLYEWRAQKGWKKKKRRIVHRRRLILYFRAVSTFFLRYRSLSPMCKNERRANGTNVYDACKV